MGRSDDWRLVRANGDRNTSLAMHSGPWYSRTTRPEFFETRQVAVIVILVGHPYFFFLYSYRDTGLRGHDGTEVLVNWNYVQVIKSPKTADVERYQLTEFFRTSPSILPDHKGMGNGFVCILSSPLVDGFFSRSSFRFC